MPSNARRPGLRQHYPQTLDFFYYPQDTTELMAPTGFVPYSQFATFDHDENMDHWAIEMLDNNFWMSDPLSTLSALSFRGLTWRCAAQGQVDEQPGPDRARPPAADGRG